MSVDFDSILERKKEYNKYKNYSLLVADLIQKSLYLKDTEKDTHLKQCGTRLFFKDNTLVAANFCRERICPMCQYRRSMKLFAEMLKCAELMENDGYRFIHIVLTIPNCTHSELNDTVDILYKSFGKFMKYKSVKKAFKGSLRALEISYNAGNCTFHPHLHCLFAVKKSYFNDSKVYLSYEKIRSIWSNCCNYDKLLQVSVSAVKSGDWQGVAEVTKYCVKPFDYSQDTVSGLAILDALGYTLKGRRFLQKYGIIQKYYKIASSSVTQSEKEMSGNDDIIEQMFDFALIWNGKKYEIEKGGY